MNRDKFNSLPARRAANSTMAILDRAQDMAPEEALASLSAAFLLAAERYGIAPQDAFTVTKNIMNHAEGRRPEFEAVRQYMENEW